MKCSLSCEIIFAMWAQGFTGGFWKERMRQNHFTVTDVMTGDNLPLIMLWLKLR